MSNMTDAHTLAILRSIDQQLLTVEDLAYYTKLPIAQVEAIVQRLWNAGDIELAKRRAVILTQSFVTAPTHPHVDRQMVFNVTPKGHFHLQPVVQRKERRK